jgi:tetratricopeptide (TPR) repeat protein
MSTLTDIFNDAVRLHRAGNLVQAEPLYRQVLAAEPAHAQAHYMLGLLVHQLGRHEEALALMRRAGALNPALPDLHLNMGVILLHLNKYADAAECFRTLLQTTPSHAEAHYNLGHVHMRLGQFAEASAYYREALRLNPRHPYAPFNLADALNNLGITLQSQGRIEESIRCYQEALAVNPQQADAHNNLGKALHAQGRLADAALCYEQALLLQPQRADVHNNLGLVHQDQSQFAEAAACFDRALQIDPDHKLALWNRCLSRLRHGDFERGWADFELRWAQPGMIRRSFDKPRWDGSALRGKTILVYAEHGLGDTIQFLRYLPLVQELGGSVVFECQAALFKLLRGVRGADEVVPLGAPLPFFDMHISLLSLPSFFVRPRVLMPNETPYLNIDPERVRFWREELRSYDGLKVGISWQGSLNQKADRRTVPLNQFAPFACQKGVCLVSLQAGAGAEQLHSWEHGKRVVRFEPEDRDMLETAALIKNLDLVVTIDSAVAHLAGALGKPVWVALPFVPCWRYLLEREDSPWYPTMRLFRQRHAEDWPGVFQRIADEISRLRSRRL